MAETNSASATPTAIAGPAATCGSAIVTERRNSRPEEVSATEDTLGERGQTGGGAHAAAHRGRRGGQRGAPEQHEHGDHARRQAAARRARGKAGDAGRDRALADRDRVAALGLSVVDGLV